MNPTRPDLHDYVRELTQPTSRRVKAIVTSTGEYEGRTITCTITIPALIDQLAQAIGFSTAESNSRSSFGSRASARIDAIDALNDITDEAGAWLKRLDAPDPHSDKLRIIRLGSLTPPLDRNTHDELEHDIRHWWTLARIITGWDTPARRPNGTCPACPQPERGTLRVRLDEWLATCVKCRATWDRATIGVLAEHIRSENGDDDTPNELEVSDVG